MIRYHASLSAACAVARYESICAWCAYHVEPTSSGLFYISNWDSSRTLYTYENGVEHKIAHTT